MKGLRFAMILLLLASFLFQPKKTYAQNYGAMLGTCSVAKAGKEEVAPHYYFSFSNAKLLLRDVKLGRKCQAKVKLLEGKLQLKDEQINLLNLQLKSADKAVKSNELARKALSLKVSKQDETIRNQQNRIAKLESEKWKNLVIGLAIGFGVAAVGATAVGIAVSMK